MATELKDLAELPEYDNLANSGPNPETDAALDSLLTEASGGKTPAELEAAFALANAEAKEKADAEAKEKADAEAKEKAATQTDEEKAKAAEAAKLAEGAKVAAAAIAAKDGLDTVELPPHTKPKTTEAFDTVKKLAREKILALEKEVEAAKIKAKEFEDKAKNVGKVDPAIAKELEELRKFRNKVDVEADPSFLQFDTKIAANIESIYKKLVEIGTPAEAIAQIKEIGPDDVAWEKVTMSTPLRRFIESKLSANLELADQKKTAIETAKNNAEEYLKTRRAEQEKAVGDQSNEVESEISTMTTGHGWMSEKTAKSDADAVERKSVEEHNKLVADIKTMMKEAATDNSPRMRALLAIGTAQFVNLRATHENREQDFKAKTAEYESKIVAIVKELETANAFIAKIKNLSTNRLRDTSAASLPGSFTQKDAFHESAADALDRHLKAANA